MTKSNKKSVAVEEDGGTTQTTDDSDEKIAGSMLLDKNSQKIVEFRGLNKFWPTTVTSWPPKTDAELGTHWMRVGYAMAWKSTKDGPKSTWLQEICNEKTPMLGNDKTHANEEKFKGEPNTIDWCARHHTNDGQCEFSTTETVTSDSLWKKPYDGLMCLISGAS